LATSTFLSLLMPATVCSTNVFDVHQRWWVFGFCHSLVIARIKLEDWVVIVVFSLVVALWQLFRFFPERQGEDGPRLLAPLKAVLNQILQHHRSGTSFRILKTTPNRAFHSGSLISNNYNLEIIFSIAGELFFVHLILEWDRFVVVGLRYAVTHLILVQMTWFFS